MSSWASLHSSVCLATGQELQVVETFDARSFTVAREIFAMGVPGDDWCEERGCFECQCGCGTHQHALLGVRKLIRSKIGIG